MAGFKVPPLTPIALPSRPLTSHALSWSCDAELAVAGDDSVHVFGPYFPCTREGRLEKQAADQPDNGGARAGDGGDKRQTRAQFASRRHFAVSNPPVAVDVNRELFEVAGLEWPYGRGDGWDDSPGALKGEEIEEVAVNRRDGKATETAGEQDDVAMEDNEDDGADDQAEDMPARPVASSRRSSTRPDKDAQSPLGDGDGDEVFSELNHLVALEWSPSGVGRNGRPVLAVLTADGTIAVYGDGLKAQRGINIAGFGGVEGQQRDLSSWIVLWAVGGRISVPGQDAGRTRGVRSFAWCCQMPNGIGDNTKHKGAFLAYQTDAKEVVILSVRSEWGKAKGTAVDTDEEMAWYVREVARFMAEGPHTEPGPWDIDFTPTGTSFGLRWSPWVMNGAKREAVIAYLDHHYIGFRRITVTNSSGTENIDVAVDDTNCDGACVHLSTDAFVQWESRIFAKHVCRALLATPSVIRHFEVSLSSGRTGKAKPTKHTTTECGTSYASYGEAEALANPIVGMALHPTGSQTLADPPHCSWVRLSATPQSRDWYQTTGSAERDAEGVLKPPQWFTDLQEKLDILVPAKAILDQAASDAGSDSEEGSDDGKDPAAHPIADDEAMPDAASDGKSEAGSQPKRAMVHPYRFRIYGMASSPGGGATAILACSFSTQHLERSHFSTYRSTVYFATRPRGSVPQNAGHRVKETRRLTAEAAMFEWMYGGGVDVPGVTAPRHIQHEERNGRATIRDIFSATFGPGDCDVCEVPLAVDAEDGRVGRCPNSHVFDLCAVSGVAIQAPGISHTCGVCGAESLRVEEMVRLAPDAEAEIRHEASGKACGNCGGRFID